MNQLALSITIAIALSTATAGTAHASPAEVAQYAHYSRATAFNYISYLDSLVARFNRIASTLSSDSDEQVSHDKLLARQLVGNIIQAQSAIHRLAMQPRYSREQAELYTELVYKLDRKADATAERIVSDLANASAPDSISATLNRQPDTSDQFHL